jgi:uncharacterized protein YkwD
MDGKRFPAIVVCAVSLGLLAAPASNAARGCPDSDTRPGVPTTTAFSNALLCSLNQERVKRDLPRLVSKAPLVRAATGHSESMRSQGYFSHDSPNGASFIDRIRRSGYMAGASAWGVGENIGWGTDNLGTPRSLLGAWMNSPPHRSNILDRRFRHIGVGVAWGSPFGGGGASVTITADFGFATH